MFENLVNKAWFSKTHETKKTGHKQIIIVHNLLKKDICQKSHLERDTVDLDNNGKIEYYKWLENA